MAEMSLGMAEDETHLPAEIDWSMLDKSRFFLLGAALFSGVSTFLYPVMVLKTRQQVSPAKLPCRKLSFAILRHEGWRGFYKGFGTSILGTVPARALYMGSLELTKSAVGSAAVRLGVPDGAGLAVANAAGGLTSAMAAQLVWTPIDVVSQRLMVQGAPAIRLPNLGSGNYRGGIDAFRRIVSAEGVRGLYKGFGVSVLTYAPSHAVWWGSYSLIWGFIGRRGGERDEEDGSCCFRPTGSSMAVAAGQGVSAAMASGVSALVTTPLDTIKTRMQVLGGREESGNPRVTIFQTVRNLVKEGGLAACYRGLGPRWASMAMSAATMISTYEFLKRSSVKNKETWASRAV